MNILKQRTLLLILFLTSVFLSCTDNNNDDFTTPRLLSVKGKVEKGPFISGSTITIQPLDKELQILGSMYNTTILDDIGNFSFGQIDFQSPYAEMMATGYFFNEVEGNLSKGVLVLRALVDLSDDTTVNVNILTHLKYARIKNLISAGKSFKEANSQAQNELLTAFGLQEYVSKDVSQFSIIAGTDESSALIAISSLLIYNRSEATLTEYIAKLSQDFGVNGAFSAYIQSQINDDKKELLGHLSRIEENIIERYIDLGVDISVKNLAAYFDWDDDGVAGNEILKDGQSVELQIASVTVPKAGGSYSINIDSPIPVYTNPIVNALPLSNVAEDTSFGESIYEGSSETASISYEAEIENESLNIVVAPARFRKQLTTNVTVYDCIGNVVAAVVITQEPDENAKLPLLGQALKNLINDVKDYLGSAFTNYNVLEQYYCYNTSLNAVPLSTNDYRVKEMWANFFKANRGFLLLKNVDEQNMNLYQEVIDVFYALYYYYMVVAWGDVPYNYGQNWEVLDKLSRINEDVILSDLKQRLLKAIDVLEEKKNQSLTDANGFFFVSKDVARIVLANIYMYQENWSEANTLLIKVMNNSYYQLYAGNEHQEPESYVSDDNEEAWETANTSLIFGLREEGVITTRVVISPACIMPIQSLADVYLLSAECNYHLGKTSEAKALLDAVTTKKNISVSTDILTGIKETRLKTLLYSGNHFAFLKRNDLAVSECGIKDYQLLFPIPQSELSLNPAITQNPGY